MSERRCICGVESEHHHAFDGDPCAYKDASGAPCKGERVHPAIPVCKEHASNAMVSFLKFLRVKP